MVLLPGRASETTSPSATMSSLIPTSGMVRVSFCSACKGNSGPATTTSGDIATRVAATASIRSFGTLTESSRDDGEVLPFDEAVAAKFVE